MMKKVKRKKTIRSAALPALILFFTLVLIAMLIYVRPYDTGDIQLDTVTVTPSAQKSSFFEKLFKAKYNFATKKAKEDDFNDLINNSKTKSGTFSVYIKNLNTGQVYKSNEDTKMYTASVYKIPTAVAVLKMIDDKKLKITDMYQYLGQDYEEGSGILYTQRVGTKYTVEDLLLHMLKNSDNVAQNIFLRVIPQQEMFNAFNILNTQSKFQADNISTNLEISNYLEEIYVGDYLSTVSKSYLFETMKKTSFDDRISKYLKEGLTFSHKIGNWPNEGNWHDCGVLYSPKDSLIVCVMSTGTTYDEFIEVCKNVAEFINELV